MVVQDSSKQKGLLSEWENQIASIVLLVNIYDVFAGSM